METKLYNVLTAMANKINNTQSTGLSVTLTSSGWTASGDKYQQTVTAQGVTASNNIVVGPAPANIDAYAESGIYAVSQAANSITFECSAVPTANLSANVIILE